MAQPSDAPVPAPATAPPTPGMVPPPPPPPSRPRRSLAWVAVVVAVVVVVASIGALYAAGVGPFSRTSAPSGPLTFSQARNVADQSASGYGGGGWSLIAASSIDTPSSVALPLSELQANLSSTLSTCPVDWINTASSVTIPGFAGSATSGQSPAWALIYKNASGGALAVGVINGAAQLEASIAGGSSCALILSYLGTIPSTVEDSPAVAAAVASAGGSAFLSAHSNASITMTLVPGISFLTLSEPSTWQVSYSLCSPTATTSSVEPAFNATVNAQTGVVTGHNTSTEDCSGVTGVIPGGSTSIGFVHAAGPAPFVTRVAP